ncbi:hypothetical protein BDR07DRAFT_1389824, partial [Suillus spraguei]
MELSATYKARCSVSSQACSRFLSTLLPQLQKLQSTMSNMISSGFYNITSTSYYDMSFAMQYNTVFADKYADLIQVNVQDEDTRLATLFDTASKMYIGFDMVEQAVAGYTDPQVLQLSPTGNDGFTIQQQDTNTMCYLQDHTDGSPIYVGDPGSTLTATGSLTWSAKT